MFREINVKKLQNDKSFVERLLCWVVFFVIATRPFYARNYHHNNTTYYYSGANLGAWQRDGQMFPPCWFSCVTSDTFMSQGQVKPLWRAAITIPTSGHLNWSVINNWTQHGSVCSCMWHDSHTYLTEIIDFEVRVGAVLWRKNCIWRFLCFSIILLAHLSNTI